MVHRSQVIQLLFCINFTCMAWAMEYNAPVANQVDNETQENAIIITSSVPHYWIINTKSSSKVTAPAMYSIPREPIVLAAASLAQQQQSSLRRK